MPSLVLGLTATLSTQLLKAQLLKELHRFQVVQMSFKAYLGLPLPPMIVPGAGYLIYEAGLQSFVSG